MKSSEATILSLVIVYSLKRSSINLSVSTNTLKQYGENFSCNGCPDRYRISWYVQINTRVWELEQLVQNQPRCIGKALERNWNKLCTSSSSTPIGISRIVTNHVISPMYGKVWQVNKIPFIKIILFCIPTQKETRIRSIYL